MKLLLARYLGDFWQRMYPSCLSVCPAAALSRQFHSVARRLLLRLAADHTSGDGEIILGKRLKIIDMVCSKSMERVVATLVPACQVQRGDASAWSPHRSGVDNAQKRLIIMLGSVPSMPHAWLTRRGTAFSLAPSVMYRTQARAVEAEDRTQ